MVEVCAFGNHVIKVAAKQNKYTHFDFEYGIV
jgi:hypothetical protein